MSSITVTVYPEDGETVEDAVRRAFVLLNERLARSAKYAPIYFTPELHEFDPDFDSGDERY